MNRLHVYLTLIFAFLMHMTLLNYIIIAGTKPDLLFLCVIFFGLFSGPALGLESGIMAGFLKDIYAFDFFGINALTGGLIGFGAGAIRTKFFRESKITQFLLVFMFQAVSMSIHFMIEVFVSRYLNMRFSDYFLRHALPSSIYTAAVSVPIFSRLISLYRLGEDDGFV